MGRLTKQDIEDRFSANVGRVQSLVNTYNILVGPGGGRSSVEHADVLRAAVLLLHAALEDLLRSTEELRLPLPTVPPKVFEALKFVPPSGVWKDAKEKFTLADLAAYRGQSVDDVIGRAIELYLDRSNYNNIADVKSAIDRAGLMNPLTNDDAATIEAMMKRRHWIAHRADPNPMSGRGHHAAQSIGRSQVDGWVSVVESFGKALLARM
jgi:hypothetical protein